MPEYYNDIITERSWETLVRLNRAYHFVLIGGWAAWLHGSAAKSRDIDIITTYEELARLKTQMPVTKNDRLAKYEIKADGFDIDIYLPRVSKTLSLPAEFVMSHTERRGGFEVPTAEVLLGLKLGAWEQRMASAKGQKDLIDIVGLLTQTDREKFAQAMPPVHRDRLISILDQATTYAKKAGLLNRWRKREPEPPGLNR